MLGETVIKVENTAISNGISNSCKLLSKNSRGSSNILDYGCGRLRNTKYLIGQGFKVSVVDTEFQLSKQEGAIKNIGVVEQYTDVTIKDCVEQYGSILCSYVLNVIPSVDERKEVLANIGRLLKEEGRAYIEVRGNSFIKNVKHKEEYADGYVVGKGSARTFQKPYSKEDIRLFIEGSGLVIEDIKSKNDSIVVVVGR